MLTEDAARSIGMSAYYPYMRKVLNGILRALDVQFGRPLIMTNMQNTNKVCDFYYFRIHGLSILFVRNLTK